ncbi:sigma-70 family RNA polymerase sigma factor [Nocardioides ferulae]|uniref:sigma-70 family RNA polymerase sigma factor n=1 Tax=Nocardioides ferulae TaxID=2340821 RepID=UPI000EAC87BD|nr:sigma-70 family RNA polymerase sigma factor [Nocardioides ferulae]
MGEDPRSVTAFIEPPVLPSPRLDRTSLRAARRRLETARLLSRARASRGERRTRYEDAVINLNLEVATEVAAAYHGRGVPDEDLDQVANLALVKAVRTFDPTQSEDFLSHAVPTLRTEIRRYFREAGWTIRPPRAVQEMQARVSAAEAELLQKLGRAPRASEIAVHLDVALTVVLDAVNATGCFAPVSLDAPVLPQERPELPYRDPEPADRAAGLPELALLDIGGEDPAFAGVEARVALNRLMDTLSERDRRIITLRYFEHRTQEQIGEEVGVSQEQVSRLITSILARLRRTLADEVA